MKNLYALLLLILSSGLSSYAQSGRIWSTYYGGTGGDGGFSVASDNNGNVFMAGITLSGNGIAVNGFQSTHGGGNTDAFLVKVNSAGQRLWGTYFGGNGDEMAFLGGKLEVAVDPFGNVFLGGLTSSTSGIASNGFQNTNAATVNAYLAKFNSAGNLIWATYYGGTALEKAYGLAADPFGNVYLAGLSMSTSGIASGGFQNSSGGGSEAFLAKFDSSGNRIWATYYGSTGTEEGYSVATDIAGNVFLAGTTNSASGIASGGSQNIFGGGANDAFLVKFDSSGNRQWATYYGGSGDELSLFSSVLSVTCDSSGNSYLTGLTTSTSGIASGGFQNVYGGGSSDAFLVKFDPAGNRLWATYYGGSDEDKSYDVAADNTAVYITGRTQSSNNISSAGFQNAIGGDQDDFVAKFDSGGSRLCATYFGKAGVDESGSVTVDVFGDVYMAGATENTTGIASGGFQNQHGGGTSDAMLVKFESDCLPTSVNETFIETRISLFPNPVSDLLFLKTVEKGNAKIYNSLGKLVLSINNISQTISFDLSGLINGVYLFQLVNSDGLITSEKFIVEHQ